MSWFDHLSLLSGAVPIGTAVAAFAALALSIASGGRRFARRVPILAAGALAAVLLLGQVTGIEHRVGSTFPHSFFAWSALPVVAAAVAVGRWADGRWRHRAVSLASVVLLVAFAAITVNQHYAYLPTVGDALGRPVKDQVQTAGHPIAVAHHLTEVQASQVVPTRGEVVVVHIPGVVSHFRARRGMVWLPPAYFRTPRPTLPTIMALAGVPGSPTDMIRGGHAVEVADRYALAHRGWAPIVVFPDHNGGFLRDTECVDGPRGNVETYLMTDVRGYVERHFGASPRGADWGIIGYSEGGTCAVTLALRHPTEVGGFVDLAGDLRPNAASGRREERMTIRRLYGGDAHEWSAHDPGALLRGRLDGHPLAMFGAGRSDRRGVGRLEVLSAEAHRAGLPTVTDLFRGGHTFVMVSEALRALFPVLADHVRHIGGGTTTGGRPVATSLHEPRHRLMT